MENRAAEGLPLLDAIPEDVDRIVYENYRSSEKLRRNYAVAARGVPRDCLIRPPAILAEVGVLVDGAEGAIVNLWTPSTTRPQ